MQAGIIGTVDGRFEDIDSFSDTRQEGPFELESALSLRRPIEGPNNTKAFHGDAAIQRVEERPSFEMQDGHIVSTQEPQISTYITEFVIAPDSFVVVESSSGLFAFDLLSQQTGASIKRGEIYLYPLLDDTEGESWQAGFYGNSGNAENGVLYGENVIQSEAAEDLVFNSTINQLGLEELEYGELSVKMTATESGYIEIYNPDLKIDQFLEFIDEFILHSVS